MRVDYAVTKRILLSATFKHMKENAYAFYPYISVDARSSWTLFPSTNTEISFHRVRTRGSTPPVIRSSARFRTNFRGNALQKLVDPRAFVPRFIHSSEDEFRNIFEIFASTQRTDLSLDRANKFLPFRRSSKTIDSKIDLIRAEREKKKTSI